MITYPDGVTCEVVIVRLRRGSPNRALLVAAAHERFDAELRLTHEGTRQVLRTPLQLFARWILRERAAEVGLPPSPTRL